MTIRVLIEAERIRQGLSHTALARAAGMSPQLWQGIRDNGVRLTSDKLDRIGEALHLDPERLAEWHALAAREAGWRV